MNFKFWTSQKPKLKARSIDDIKALCKILFIDDKSFPLIEILKDSGWKNTSRIKDADTLEQTEIREAHILVVDIQGVWKKLRFKDEWLWLIIALKWKYPWKKIIAYSAEEQDKIQAFHAGIDMADKRLSKNSDPYQFTIAIETFANELFSLSECITRIQEQILKEFWHSVESEKVMKNLNILYLNKNYDTETVSKVFNLQNAGNIASILQLFFSA